MKQIIFITCLICLVICVLTETHIHALNVEQRSAVSCEDMEVYDNGQWRDNAIEGLSECVDLDLRSTKGINAYYARCCYVRFQVDGDMHHGCIGLTQDQFSDTTETIDKMEKGDTSIWSVPSTNLKIYQLDCSSSYLKFISLAIVLIGLLA